MRRKFWRAAGYPSVHRSWRPKREPSYWSELFRDLLNLSIKPLNRHREYYYIKRLAALATLIRQARVAQSCGDLIAPLGAADGIGFRDVRGTKAGLNFQ